MTFCYGVDQLLAAAVLFQPALMGPPRADNARKVT